MDNYARSQEAARRRFLTYDIACCAEKTGVHIENNRLFTPFLGETAEISLLTGEITLDGRPADHSESMTLYDWLCDGSYYARPSGRFAPVASLPGIRVSGNGLLIGGGELAGRIDPDPEAFRRACLALGGIPREAGDIGFMLPLFADLTVLLKFYHGDEEFPPTLTFLWDENILQYIRYETVYYLAGCLCRRLALLLSAERK